MEMDEMLQKAKKTQVQRKKGPRWTGKKRVSGWPGSKIENWREDNACLWWNINFDDKSTCFTMTGKLKRAQVDWEGNWGEDSLSLSSTIYNLSISGKLKKRPGLTGMGIEGKRGQCLPVVRELSVIPWYQPNYTQHCSGVEPLDKIRNKNTQNINNMYTTQIYRHNFLFQTLPCFIFNTNLGMSSRFLFNIVLFSQHRPSKAIRGQLHETR